MISTEFWIIFKDKVTEFYGNETIPIWDMLKLQNYLGLKYVDAENIKNCTHWNFIFEVVDKNKFLLTRIKYGI